MLLKNRLILYIIEDGFFYFKRNQINFDNFVSFENKNLLNEFVSKIQKNTQVELILDFSDEEINIEDVPELHFWEKAKYIDILTLKHKDKRVDKLIIDFIKFEDKSREIARIFKIFNNQSLANFYGKLISNDVFVSGIYSSTLIFELFYKSFYFRNTKKKFDAKQEVFIVRRTQNSYKILFFLNQKIFFSRVIDLHDEVMNDEQKYDYIARESDMTIRYLNNVGLLDLSVSLKIYLLDDVNSNVAKIENKLNKSLLIKSEFHDEEVLSNLFVVLSPQSLCKNNVKPSYLAWFPCALKGLRKPPRLSDPYADLVHNAALLGNFLTAAVLVVFVLGSYYLGSIASKYLFLNDKIDYLERKISYLSKMKSKLEAAIDIPYDARDLKKIVEFSQKFPIESSGLEITQPIVVLANLLQNNKDIILLNLQIKRTSSNNNLINGSFTLKGEFFINKPSVLYQDNLNRIYKFGQELKQKYININYLSLPIETNPSKNLNVNDGMILPKIVPFSIKFEWKSNE